MKIISRLDTFPGGLPCRRRLPSWAADTGSATRNVVLVTADGVRWQDVFRGADGLAE